MPRSYRLSMMGFSIAILLGLGLYTKGNLSFLLNDFWFSSGLLLLILLSLIDQPHFSKDANVFVNAVTAGVSLLLVPDGKRSFLFWTFLSLTTYLVAASYGLMWIRSKSLENETPIIGLISRINRAIGRPEAIFSAFFIWGAVNQFGAESKEFNLLMWFWVLFMILNIPQISSAISTFFASKVDEKNESEIGKIFGVQSKNTFLVKLNEDRPIARVFDFVEYKYSIDQRIRKGIIIDVYLLNQEQWVKVLTNRDVEEIFDNKNLFNRHENDSVYKIGQEHGVEYLKRLVGIVTENSNIGKVKFIFNSKIRIGEGQLLEASIDDQRVLYQIVEGVTKIELLEEKNQTALIIGEAMQLGVWNDQKAKFEQFGWVPGINTPVYIASPITTPTINANEYVVGNIPSTNYPVILNKDLAITHHTAILGVTGTGKSVFARNLIRQLIKDEKTKVICCDFTNEYKARFTAEGLSPIIPEPDNESIFKCIEWILAEHEKFANQQDKDNLKKADEKIRRLFSESIDSFLKDTSKKLSLFELPDISNTVGILEYTKYFFSELFKSAKNKKLYGNKVSVVLEEAHTIIPEWNFLGSSDKTSQSLVNKISQIALQGRKYEIGFMVIAQRTANVSKTVLTQCNSIIAFQEFDKTSSEFLANYFGQDIAKILPNLKFRQAVAAGKAFRSTVPIIFEVPFIEEEIIAVHHTTLISEAAGKPA